jgi:transposase
MNRNDLERLSREELIELVLRLQRPEKTSRNSSKPPSTDRKEKRENSKPGGAKPGHEGHTRSLTENPDAFEDHAPTHCPCCGLAYNDEAKRTLIGESDEIELPPIRPFVRRHRRFSIQCSRCGEAAPAPLPPAMLGTPFGPRIHALAVYLKSLQLFSHERLRAAFDGLFGLSISEGALMNMFKRMQAAFQAKRTQALALLRKASFVACDETGARIEGVNAYHWVFCCKEAVVHSAAFTRGAQVVREVLDGHRPAVWTSDRYGAQQGHADRQQTCLAHLDRDARFADENSDDLAPMRLRLWFGRVFALARDIETIAASTLRAKRRALQRDLTAILNASTSCPLTQELLAKVARARDQLLTFCDFAGEVDPTNNLSERKLRPCVIQRKVTNGYRAEWAADFEASVRTAVDTARLAGAGPFQTLLEIVVPGSCARPFPIAAVRLSPQNRP